MNFEDVIDLLSTLLSSLFWITFLLFLLVGIISSFIPRSKNKQHEEELRLKRNIDALAIKNRELEQEIARCKDIIQSYVDHTNADYLDKVQAIDHCVSVAMSNLTALPYMSAIIADYDTRRLDILAQQLNWGHDQKRLKKVQSILEIKREAKNLIASCKEAEYQLAYAIAMFPALEDFLCTDYTQLPSVSFSDLDSDNRDSVRNYLSKEEYAKLSTVERNQMALDRYRESHRKSNWQIGRDYEQYVGYKYSLKGYAIDYYGSYNGLEDLGRDLIATRGDLTLIIQCKYWSSKKQIHEKHINQLYGTMACYRFEKNLPEENVRGILVTNITASLTAKKFASYLGIEVVENYALGNYPCIKCNINRNEWGEETKIYHLPFDQQYDSCKIDAPGEFYATTVAEAENAGFRRAFRWHDSK